MNEKQLSSILHDLQKRRIDIREVIAQLRRLPEQTLPSASLDHHRCLRTGIPEAIFAQEKNAGQLIEILKAQLQQDHVVLATRVDPGKAAAVCAELPTLRYHKTARMLTGNEEKIDLAQNESSAILVVTAGTSDLPVAEEARITLHCLGHRVTTIGDAGVAGLHRILRHQESLQQAQAIIVVAGMEGALPTVVAGMTPAPVIGVPTSVGYGTGAGGFAALLGMLNSCAPGLAVVNIDNGFGAACMAAAICR
ncbi:MAG: nickel pincer cofactor biosynthesis protein LarB [Desulfobulbus sp.]|nr:MAG: nickel pincer cofactor biosynthesis protein LarB [Desulfobulbus sp.]